MDKNEFKEFKLLVAKYKFSLMDFDRHVFSRMNGFATVEDYELYMNTNGRLNQVTVPTLYLNSHDDPVISPELYPYKEFSTNENGNILFAITQRGAHCSHFTGNVIPY